MQNWHRPVLPFAPEDFQHALLRWYDGARRHLPWRAPPGAVPDPYRVWLSEIMLQQTTVKAVIPYFERFTKRWPTIEALGSAPREDVLAAWAGLGYYSRARNLHAAAQLLARDGFPATAKALRALPGIGTYTAAAIASIAFGEPAAVVDGNIARVLARIFVLDAPLPSAKRAIAAFATSLTPTDRPGDYAQAMMDLGSTICSARAPSCHRCPVRTFCSGYAQGRPDDFPVKASKPERPRRCGDAFVILSMRGDEADVLLRRRPDGGLLGGMLEVPCTDWVPSQTIEDRGDPNLTLRLGKWGSRWQSAQTVRHTFTHFRLEMRVFATRTATPGEAEATFGGQWAALSDLPELALPTVMKKAVAAGLEALDFERDRARAGAASHVSGVSVEAAARPKRK